MELSLLWYQGLKLVFSVLPCAGTITTRPGTLMAASDRFAFTVIGKGGHGAIPNLANDPVVSGLCPSLPVQLLHLLAQAQSCGLVGYTPAYNLVVVGQSVLQVWLGVLPSASVFGARPCSRQVCRIGSLLQKAHTHLDKCFLHPR